MSRGRALQVLSMHGAIFTGAPAGDSWWWRLNMPSKRVSVHFIPSSESSFLTCLGFF